MLKVQDHRIRVAAGRREEMRNRLLLSAVLLASDTSIHDIGVDEIIAHAQVSRGTFYKYFSSVSVLYQDLARQLAQELSSTVEAVTLSSVDCAVRLASTSRVIMRLLVDLPTLGKLLIQLPWLNQNHKLDSFQTLRHEIEQGIKAGIFEQVPVTIGLNLVIGSMVGGVHAMLLKPPSAGYENIVIRQALIGLGLETSVAAKVSTIPLPATVPLLTGGVLEKIGMLHKTSTTLYGQNNPSSLS